MIGLNIRTIDRTFMFPSVERLQQVVKIVCERKYPLLSLWELADIVFDGKIEKCRYQIIYVGYPCELTDEKFLAKISNL